MTRHPSNRAERRAQSDRATARRNEIRALVEARKRLRPTNPREA